MSRNRSKIAPEVDFLTKNVEIVPKSDPKSEPKIDKKSLKSQPRSPRWPKGVPGPPWDPKVLQKTPKVIPEGIQTNEKSMPRMPRGNLFSDTRSYTFVHHLTSKTFQKKLLTPIFSNPKR